MSEAGDIGVVILAAGSSSRLGEPKQLVTFEDEPLLQKMIDQCAPFEFGSRVLVVGANSEVIQENVEPGAFDILFNEKWEEGIASSIRTGVAYSLEVNPKTKHLLFLLSDQPFVTAELLQKLLDTHSSGSKEITASFYKGDVGAPAIYSETMFPRLMKLSGDQGAKKIMKHFPGKVNSVPFKMGYFDIDTREDYEELRKFET